METALIPKRVADFLESKEEILLLVNLLTKYQNSYLEKGTEIKTISGIRELIEKAEMQENIDDYLVKRIKRFGNRGYARNSRIGDNYRR